MLKFMRNSKRLPSREMTAPSCNHTNGERTKIENCANAKWIVLERGKEPRDEDKGAGIQSQKEKKSLPLCIIQELQFHRLQINLR